MNLSSGLTHPLDRPKVVWAFKIFREAGYVWEPADVRSWALANGWRPSGARDLSEVADGVKARKALRGGKNPFKASIIRLWEGQADGGEAR